MVSGIITNDFINSPLKDFGQNITLNRVTKTVSNLTGTRTLTYGSDETVKVVKLRRNAIHDYLKEGLIEEGDAYVMARTTDAIERGDKITDSDGVIYRVENTINRNPDGSTPMFTMCSLHVITA